MEEGAPRPDLALLLEAAADFGSYPGLQSNDSAKEFLNRFPLPVLFGVLQNEAGVPGLEDTIVACLDRLFQTKYGASLLPQHLVAKHCARSSGSSGGKRPLETSQSSTEMGRQKRPSLPMPNSNIFLPPINTKCYEMRLAEKPDFLFVAAFKGVKDLYPSPSVLRAGCGGYILNIETGVAESIFAVPLSHQVNAEIAEAAGALEVVRHAVSKGTFPLVIFGSNLKVVAALRGEFFFQDYRVRSYILECQRLLTWTNKLWKVFLVPKEENEAAEYIACQAKKYSY